MQSQGWIWQTFLLLLAFGIVSSAPCQSTFAQTETPEQNSKSEKAEDDNKTPETAPEKDTPSKEDSSDENSEGEKKDDKKPESSKTDQKDADKKDVTADENGSKDLDDAFMLNIEARTTADLDRIAQLCESALKKGLDESETQQAKLLAAESLQRFANSLAQRTFATPRDRRWQVYRAQAIPRLQKAIEFDSNSVAAYILLAKFQSIDRRERDAAIENIQKAIELAAEDRGQLSDALVIRAGLTADPEARLADLKQAIKLNPVNYRARELRGRLLLSEGKVNEAVEDFDVMLEGQPKNFLARIFVATSLRQTGEKFTDELQEKAIAMLDQASEIQPKSEIPLVIKSEIQLRQKSYESAIESASLAIERKPKAPGSYAIRARARAATKDFEGAYKDADSLIELDTKAGHLLRVDLFVGQGRFDKAIDDLKILSRANPSDTNLKRRMGIYYSEISRPKEAIKIYKRLLRGVSVDDLKAASGNQKRVLLSRRADLLSLRGNARLGLGEHAEAVKDYEESLKLFDQLLKILPDNITPKPTRDSGLLNNLAWVLSTSPDDAVRNGKRAIELAEESAKITENKMPHILSTVASAYAETGDFDSAIEWIEKGIEANKTLAKEINDPERTAEQLSSLTDELESYKQKKPWRELQDPEKERLEREEKLKSFEMKSDDSSAKSNSKNDDDEADTNDDESDDDENKEPKQKESADDSNDDSDENGGDADKH
jgi:predicted Zn-dependent protease